jgi:hypothetical protein
MDKKKQLESLKQSAELIRAQIQEIQNQIKELENQLRLPEETLTMILTQIATLEGRTVGITTPRLLGSRSRRIPTPDVLKALGGKKHRCTRCKLEKDIIDDFGWRKIGNEWKSYPWCRKCRSAGSKYPKPRNPDE